MNQDRIHALTLRFESPETEAAWREFDDRVSIPRLRFTLALALALYAAFALLDLSVAPAVVGRLWTIRAVVCAAIVLVLASTWSPSFGRYRQVLLGGTIGLTAGGIVGMLAITEGSVESLYYVGLILVLMATHAFGWVRFPVAVGVSIAIVLGYDAELLWSRDVEPVVAINNHFFFLSATILGMVASYSSERYARWNFRNARRVEVERGRSDRLLRNILPDPVAERLKEGAGPVAEGFPEVSVLFADIVDFSTMSTHYAPEALVARLDAIFTTMDGIAERFGIEKIKTIGDAYMAVSGLPVPRPDHAERMADAALAILEEFSDPRWSDEDPVRLRIGLAIGPVVAGVIGRSKFIYDLWGEPVTIASRMQLHGLPGRIQVTDRVRRRLGHRFAFERRGEIDVKGRGPTTTYWLTGRRTPARAGVGPDGEQAADPVAAEALPASEGPAA